jgi:hypothetical protein
MLIVVKGGFEERVSLALGHGSMWKPTWKGRARDPALVVLVDAYPPCHVRWGEEQKAHGTGPSSGLWVGSVREVGDY